jgi:PAS domain S-box-containing protein
MEFQRRLRRLVFIAWSFPPVVGLGVIMLIGVLSPSRILQILVTPLEPAYIFLWLVFAVWYFPRNMRAVSDWLDNAPGSSHEAAVAAVRGFPLLFWSIFIFYLMLAPFSVIWAAEIYTGFVSSPIILFRIELVALIVSIIVGLPIFFLMFDLFGHGLGRLELKRPILAIRTKVFLIGAMIPLLIDTMLVQYYWTRTGFFDLETFAMWALLELLAIGGSLIFAHSFGQSLAPLQVYGGAANPLMKANVAALKATSTDELGVLTGDYRRLLDSLRAQNEIQEFNNLLIRSTSLETQKGGVFREIVKICHGALGADLAFVMMHDADTNELASVIQTGEEYDESGHFRLKLDEKSLAVWSFNNDQTIALDDCSEDPRVSPRMREQFGVHGAIATPLRFGDKTEGVLMAISRGGEMHYGPYETSLIEGIAREAVQSLNTLQLREERLRAEDARREQEAQVRLLMDTTEEGIYGVDLEGNCTFINRAGLEMLGYKKPGDLIGEDIHSKIHHTLPDGRPYPKSDCRVRLATLGGTIAHSDDELHWRADGSSFPTEYWSRPIRRNGQIIGTVVSFIDITERKQTEKELRIYREKLEQLVALRTSELETVNRELESFSYSVSHDLRAPLRAVDGFARALMEDYGEKIDENGIDFIQRIRRGAQKMSVLIDDLLDLSRISRTEIKRSAIDLTTLATQIVSELEATEPDRNVEVSIAPKLVAEGDKRLIAVVLQNLLDNAWKYSSKKTDARIEFKSEQLDGETVFCVCDNGAGFDEQYIDKLFRAFQRLHGAEFPGTGIGLATVARIIQKHGGRIWAKGKPGKGASFYFVLSSANAESEESSIKTGTD